MLLCPSALLLACCVLQTTDLVEQTKECKTCGRQQVKLVSPNKAPQGAPLEDNMSRLRLLGLAAAGDEAGGSSTASRSRGLAGAEPVPGLGCRLPMQKPLCVAVVYSGLRGSPDGTI